MRDRIGEHSAESANRQQVLNMDHDRLMAKKVKYRVGYYTLREVARNCGVPYSFVNDHMFQTFGFPAVVRCGERTVNKPDLLVWLRTMAGREFVGMARKYYGEIDMEWVDGYDEADDIDGCGPGAGDKAHERGQGHGQPGIPADQDGTVRDAVRQGGAVLGVAPQPGRAEVAERKKRVAHIERPCSLSEQIRRRREAENVTPMQYLRVNNFLDRLKRATKLMSHQEFMTLRGQAVHGDIEGAEKGFRKILERGGYL